MATENKTAVTQLFDIIKGVAQYSEDNPLLNQILMSEKRLLEIEVQQHAQTALHMLEHATLFLKQKTKVGLEDEFNNYFSQTYGGDNENK